MTPDYAKEAHNTQRRAGNGAGSLDFDRDFEPEQDENGIDLSHIRENLKLTPRERLAKLEKSLADLYILQQGMPARQKG